MITSHIALVIIQAFMAARNDVHGAICHFGIMKGDPHSGASAGIRNLEVRIVLVPTCPCPLPGRLKEDLVELKHKILTNQHSNCVANFLRKGERTEKVAMGADGTNLEVCLGGRMGLPVSIGSHIAQFPCIDDADSGRPA